MPTLIWFDVETMLFTEASKFRDRLFPLRPQKSCVHEISHTHFTPIQDSLDVQENGAAEPKLKPSLPTLPDANSDFLIEAWDR